MLRTNTQEEQAQIQEFVAKIGGVDYRQVVPDPPDGVFDFSGKKIGIEHRRLISSQGVKAFASLMNQCIENAEQRFDDPYPGALYVMLSINKRVIITNNDKQSISNDILSVVHRHLPASDEWRHIEGWQEKRRGRPFPKGVVSIAINRNSSHKQSLWSASFGLSPPPLNPDTGKLREALKEKEDRLSNYQAGYDECWLLFVVVTGELAAWWDLDDFPRNSRLQSSFDRIYLFDDFGRQNYRLK